MPKVKFDVSNVDDVADRTQAPVGIYRAEIVKCDGPKPSKNGNQMLEIQYHLTHNPKGQKLKEDFGDIWDYPILDHDHDFVKARLKEFLLAVTGKKKGTLDTDKIVGTKVQLKLKSDTNEDGDYRPRVGKVMSASEEQAEPEDEDEGEEEAEDDATNSYSEEELNDLTKESLIEVAEEHGLEAPARYTKGNKAKLIAAILEAQEEPEEEDEEDEEDEDEGIDLEALDRSELKALIKDEELEIKVRKSMSDEDLRAAIADALDEGDEEEDEDEDEGEDDEDEDEDEGDEEEAEDYASWPVADLKAELKERELNTSGPKKVLIGRLEKDDASDPF